MKLFVMVAAAILGFTAATASASAATVTFDFTKSSIGAAGGSSTGNAMGNTFSFTSGGLTLTTRGFSLDDLNSGTQFVAGAMGYYGGAGLGVCNYVEGVNCSSPNHQIDNSGRNDFVLLQFSPNIQIASATLQTYSGADTDASYYLGTTANPLALAGKSFGSLSSLGFGGRNNANSSTGTNTVSAGSATGGTFNSLLLAAYLGQTDDAFKLKALTITYADPAATVPEPASLALIGSALALVGAARRRKA